MKSIFEKFPSLEELHNRHRKQHDNVISDVNNHFHTPYSFSAFTNMKEVFEMAEKEQVKVLGINDFFTTSGYREFTELSLAFKKFPLYNIEFMGLLIEEQKKGIRINDPNNPGRIYFCGKGLDYPVAADSIAMKTIIYLGKESLVQTKEMLEKASAHIVKTDPGLSLDYNETLKNLTKGMLRERHIAKAVRMKVFEVFKSDKERKRILTSVFSGQECKSEVDNITSLEDEIRNRLLKSGGPGFVPEDPKIFLEINEIIKIIVEAGGIPTYPLLLDDKNDSFTDFERDKELLFSELVSRNIYSIEFIPGRNSIKRLKDYCSFFHSKKFIISFGTEHNSPEMMPLTVKTRGGIPLDEELKQYSYEGACVIAAHQYLRSKSKPGYINKNGIPEFDKREEFVENGKAVINYFLNH